MDQTRGGLTANDSADLIAAGLPYNPSVVSLVVDSATCQSIINNYNAANAHHISSGYLVSADSAFVLFIPPREVAYFDKTRRYLFSQSGLD